ncbi:envelope protein gp120/gp41 [Human immunodeficiency virus 1]|uniref:Envelope glycoprotein gp160 n=1 Tax=Human immunodeficiency virus type 1 group O (isolate MVP5180) TaxID=388816 RepID=ENV_HV1MV|nr:RecName: Full=Envelope glycoprotein gp160; AltName: Full=Env polyprotein; Contains: RecName: Full=Surface protein gp120; Short=SU; AltName: Full=Glycoprotein 120; Short=gp120; Contains: RecName: Full=Transmembrane protein gp41; Short=TM; AltName: Full=Glycoprotein 41; Short=gp41; Flags: Precursor [HIV-1 O_MVP5180]AAA44864.1 envelope protein gp120/gp41 [Human immunodeficiency virus 1]
MTVTMKVMKKNNRKSWSLYIAMALLIPCLSYSKQLYATVYSGVPVWEEAAPVLFCASDANLTSTEQHNIWASQACVPTDPNPHEFPLGNVTDNFDIWKNYMVDQMHEDIISLWEQSLKPCEKMTFLCVQMNCVDLQTNKTGLLNETINEMRNCSFNVTTVLTDKKEQKQALFYVSDLSKVNDSNAVNGTTYMLTNCNSTIIKQACPKVSFEPIPIHYCAPTGYAIFKCNDTDFNGTGLCHNISVVTCTHGIKPTVSTQLILNGTLSREKIRIMGKNITESAKNIIVTLNTPINMTCIREGIAEVQDIYTGPMRWRSMTLKRSNNTSPRSRVAYCTYNKTVWENALQQTAIRYLNLVNQTENVTIIFSRTSGGDAEVSHLHFNCHGEFFYCNTSGMFNYTFINCTKSGCQEIKGSNETNKNGTIPCKLRQLVRSWMKGESRIYAPPIPGNLTCHSNITGMILQLDQPWNSTGENTLRPVGGDMKDIWRTKLYNYKVVQIKPFSVAPTKMSRPIINIHTPHREKRAVGLGMLFLGVLSAAGSTMGAAATALTVRTHSVLKGIVQQQDNLLRAIQAQQHLLRLSVWGIRQLRARLQALETLIQNQQRLNLWGCKGKLICYTSVKWNTSWSGRYNDDSIWDNLTWQQWDQHINNVSSIIYDEIQAAQDQQEKNVKALLELDEWASLWNWFDITKWLWYIKIAIIIVGALIGIRVIMIILNLVKNIRQGYQPLSLQIPVPHRQEAETPGRTGEEGGEGDRPKWTALPPGFLQQLYTDLRTIILWTYHLLSNLISGIRRLIDYLGLGLWILGQKTIEACRLCGAVMQYWLQELKNSATNLLDTIAVSVANWTDGIILGLQRIGQGFLHIPRRIRQGAERILV